MKINNKTKFLQEDVMSLKRSVFSLVCLFSALPLLTGCFENPSDSNSGNIDIKEGILFVAESDFQSGLMEKVSITSGVVSNDPISIYSDAVLRTFGGYLYVIERYGADNIIKIDPRKNGNASIIYQHHLGNNCNPQDIEFVNENKAYIANSNRPEITIFDPLNRNCTGKIDISIYTFNPDSNTSPYANDLLLVGNTLYALLQRRDGYKPGGTTLILKINTVADTIEDTIPLKYKNGYGMAYANGALFISNPGSPYITGDGAIEQLDLTSKEVTTIIDETTLGGNPNEIVHKTGSRFYVTNYIGWKNVKVVEIDAASGKVVATLPGVKDAFGGIFYDEVTEKLYIGERDSVETGIRIFKENVQVGQIIKTNLPPIDMVVVR